MKIAEVADLWEAVPPKRYGGAETIVSAVTEGLVKKGCEVTLFATGDSITKANLVYTRPEAVGHVRPSPFVTQVMRTRHLAKVAIMVNQNNYDVVHSHILETIALLPFLRQPLVTTLHTNLSYPPEQAILNLPEAQQSLFVSISDAQRKALPHLPYVKTIYHGIPVADFPWRAEPGEYILFVGRIMPEKGVEFAVDVSCLTGRKLMVAAKVDEPMSDYARQMLALFKRTPTVEWLGQVGEEKKSLYANAYALLMPIQWEEPFGLVVIEALAGGTPVIAFRRGAMPEIIEHGRTGFIVNSVKEMAGVLPKVAALDRRSCREVCEKRFTVERMVSEYENLFQELVSSQANKAATV